MQCYDAAASCSVFVGVLRYFFLLLFHVYFLVLSSGMWTRKFSIELLNIYRRERYMTASCIAHSPPRSFSAYQFWNTGDWTVAFKTLKLSLVNVHNLRNVLKLSVKTKAAVRHENTCFFDNIL